MENKEINKEKISIVGLGKLGLPLTVCFAARGFKTIGIDIQKKVVDSVNRGVAPFFEPNLQEYLTKFRHNFRATQSYEEAIKETDITFVLVATPSDLEGNFSNEYVESALKSLAQVLSKNQKPYHLFIISSTVMPSSTRERLIPLIEEHSGRKLNVGFGVCYVPDFIALGKAIKDFLNPDLVVIGESDKFAGDQIEFIYRKFCENKPYIARLSIVSAEIAKMILNNYITLKLSFANMLANLCEKIPGSDIDGITKAIGADKRISPYYFKGGLGFGGTCFPRDIKAYLVLAEKYGGEIDLIKAIKKINDFQDKHLAETVLKYVSSKDNKKVSVLGLAFKPETPVIVESPAIKLIKELLRHNIKITAYDRLAMDNTKAIFHDKIDYAASVKDCVSKSNVCVITTQADEFKNIDYSYIVHDPTVVIDCWRMLNPQKLGEKTKYIALGRADNPT